jgi:hypothetical protein
MLSFLLGIIAGFYMGIFTYGAKIVNRSKGNGLMTIFGGCYKVVAAEGLQQTNTKENAKGEYDD